MTTTHHKIFKSFLRPSPISFIFQPPCRPLCTHKNFRSNLSALPRKNRYTTQVEDIWTINSQDRAPAWLHEARTPVLIALTLWAAFSLMNWIRRSRHVDAEAGRQDPPGFVSPAERWAATYLGQAADQRGEEQPESHAQIMCCCQTVEGAASLGFMSMSGFFREATDRYSSGPGGRSRITGLMLALPSCTLHFLEGDLSALCALLREMRPETANQHMMSQGRVVAFIPEASSRIFSSWHPASASVVSSRRLRSRKATVLDKTRTVTPMGEAEVVKAVEDVELFVRLLAAKIETLPTEEEKSLLLEHFSGLEASLPSQSTISGLATAQVVPSISEFVAEHDSEFLRFKTIVSEEGLDQRADSIHGEDVVREDLPEVKRLRYLYQKHLDWERRKEAEAQAGAPKSVLHHYYPRSK